MINLNGTDYYTKDELKVDELTMSEHVVVICDRGWIFEGRTAMHSEDGMDLTHAHVVRKWTNGMGIGGIQSAEHKDEYTLDTLPSGIRIAASTIIAVLPITEW